MFLVHPSMAVILRTGVNLKTKKIEVTSTYIFMYSKVLGDNRLRILTVVHFVRPKTLTNDVYAGSPATSLTILCHKAALFLAQS